MPPRKTGEVHIRNTPMAEIAVCGQRGPVRWAMSRKYATCVTCRARLAELIAARALS
jgi:hypothetical protein